MCRFADPPEKVETETFTGYKNVLWVNGKFISPVTGVVYEEGKEVPEPKIYTPIFEDSSWKPFSDICNNPNLFSELMKGRTAVFINKEMAVTYREDSETTVEMTLSEDLIKGTYMRIFSLTPVVAGRRVEKIKVIEPARLEPRLLVTID